MKNMKLQKNFKLERNVKQIKNYFEDSWYDTVDYGEVIYSEGKYEQRHDYYQNTKLSRCNMCPNLGTNSCKGIYDIYDCKYLI